MIKQTILVTGGSGYIGSHTVVELLAAGYTVVIIDSLVNSKLQVLDRIEQISGIKPTFYQVDIRDRDALAAVFKQHQFAAVIHFAALKAVGESVAKPLTYYQNNVAGSLTLLEVMAEHNVKRLVFSSSATVYGEPHTSPILEDFPLHPESPYGWSKLMVEQAMRDVYQSDSSWSLGLLRYFNPVGAHPSGLIGEDPQGIPNNLMPYISQVAVGKRSHVNIFGNDYPTRDGTGVRDYIHVVDLAHGHVCALDYLMQHRELITVNLGTGQGCSVLEVIAAFAEACGREIPYQFQERRPGDVPEYFADPSYAQQLLGWQTKRDLLTMCQDSWRWQSQNPNGYN